ncbi:MAG: thioredoxin, partial [Chloroflexi bacterium]
FDGPTFEADVLHATEPVVVDFYADWCHPCHMMGPVVEQLAGEFAGKVKIGKLDVDANEEIAIRYGVMGIPTLGLFRDGKMVDRLVGYRPFFTRVALAAGFTPAATLFETSAKRRLQ